MRENTQSPRKGEYPDKPRKDATSMRPVSMPAPVGACVVRVAIFEACHKHGKTPPPWRGVVKA